MAQLSRRTRAAVLASVLAAFAVWQPAAAGERVLHRSVLPDGRVVYGDESAPGATEVRDLRVEPHPADPQQASRAREALQQQRTATLRAFELRRARIGELDGMIANATAALDAARLQRQQAGMEREGDRQGRRLTPQYLQRQLQAAAQEQTAARRLGTLQQERAALRP